VGATRPIKTRQLFIYGEPSKEKNVPIILMGKSIFFDPIFFKKEGPGPKGSYLYNSVPIYTRL